MARRYHLQGAVGEEAEIGIRVSCYWQHGRQVMGKWHQIMVVKVERDKTLVCAG